MNFLRKKLFWVGCAFSVVVVSIVVAVLGWCWPTPQITTPSRIAAAAVNSQSYHMQVTGADSFGHAGLYIRRAPELVTGNEYWGSVEKVLANNTPSFQPEYKTLRKVNDVWREVTTDDFTIAVQSDQRSVIWTLRETAPIGVYGIACEYFVDDSFNREIFQIVYSEDWTFVAVTDAKNQTAMKNFKGGRNRGLSLAINYNDGALVYSTLEDINELPNKAQYGALSQKNIVAAKEFKVSVMTVSGKAYASDDIYTEVSDNMMTLYLDKYLGKDIYIVKFYLPQEERIFGQYVIDNRGSSSGVNLSQAWTFFMGFGGFLLFGAAVAFFAPLILSKINSNRVYKENSRVARMKNPDAYVGKSGTLLERIKNKMSKIGKPVAKEDEANKPKAENAPHTSKFAQMLQENREKRAYMSQYGLSREKVEEMQRQNEALKEMQKHSFAALREDEDSEIASLKKEEEQISTIETGSYIEDGVTFAKLDSLRDEDDDDHPDDEQA